MPRSNQLTWGLGLGYLLGRRRKLRAAMVLAAAVAATRLTRFGAVKSGDGRGDGPGDGALGAVAKLGLAGRAAARTALEQPLQTLGQRIEHAADAVRGGNTSGSR